MEERKRNAIVIAGKACALCVLLMSFSGDITAKAGINYFQHSSFIVCGIAAVVFLLLSTHLITQNSRCIFGMTVLILVLIWCGLLAYLQLFSFEAAPFPVVFLFATCGRLATLFVNVEWNFHYSLNSVNHSGHLTAIMVFLSCGLFLFSELLTGIGAAALMGVLLMGSCVLNLYLIVREGEFKQLPTSLSSVEQADQSLKVDSRSLPRTRILYFGTRVIYGTGLGVLICLVSPVPPSAPQSRVLTVLCLVVFLLVLGFMILENKNLAKGWFEVGAAPGLSAALISIVFLQGSLVSLVGLLAVFVELAWSTQNLFQLPTYRRITKINPAIFSYFEYAAQIIPFYFSVTLFYPLLFQSGVLFDLQLLAFLATVLFTVLFSFSLGAIIRHMIQYQPVPVREVPVQKEYNSRELPKELETLTPREWDVLELLASGYSRPYIAKTLYLADGTVKTHVRHIYAKLGVGSQDELIEFVHINLITLHSKECE